LEYDKRSGNARERCNTGMVVVEVAERVRKVVGEMERLQCLTSEEVLDTGSSDSDREGVVEA
jgi:hypothetical protein